MRKGAKVVGNREKRPEKVDFRSKISLESGKARIMAGVLMLLFLGSGILSGCGTQELEERNFPIELAVNNTKNFGAEWLDAEKDGNRVVDYNHLKVIILAKEFLEDKNAMAEFLDLLENKSDVPRNTYIVAAEDADEILKLGENPAESAGNYIEELLENVSEVNKKAYPTLGMLYQEEENRTETYYIPFFVNQDGKPAIDHYYVWKRGEAAGEVDRAAAMLSFFTQNELDSYTIELGEGSFVRLFDEKNQIEFSEGEDHTVTVNVRCSGEVLYQNEKSKLSTRQLENLAEQSMNDAALGMLREQEIDITGSYRKIGGFKREWYRYYKEHGSEYEKDLNIVYNVQITWVTL